MANPMQVMQMYQQFRQNPLSFLSRRFQIPQGVQDPQAIVQHLLNSGQISQAQLNSVMQMRNNPQFSNLFR